MNLLVCISSRMVERERFISHIGFGFLTIIAFLNTPTGVFFVFRQFKACERFRGGGEQKFFLKSPAKLMKGVKTVKIDIHNHLYPPDYLKALETVGDFGITLDAAGNKIITDKGSRVVTLTEQMVDTDLRLSEMDRNGIDVQVLSLTIPNAYFPDAGAARELAIMSNEYYVGLKQRYPNRFWCLASVPLPHVNDAVAEMERALTRLKMNGIVLGTNILSEYLDAPQFAPFFEAADKLGATILLHPMVPPGVEKMNDFGLAPLVGFVFDTTITVARMVFSGFLERYPNINFILPHLGGTVPYLFGRWEIGWRAYPECKNRISASPVQLLKRLYYDVVSLHGPALMCAYHSVGVDRLLLGTDYPHVIGDTVKVIESVERLDIPAEEKESIFSQNALRILNNT